MSTELESALKECKSGNLAAFDVLYQHYVGPIYAFVYRRTFDKATAEDITSNTFLKALEKIRSHDETRGAFSSWLYSIARNAVTDHYRTKHPTQDIETVWDLSSSENVEDIADRSIDFEKVRSAINALDKEKREIMIMRLWDGLSYAEIAQITGKTENNCKVIACRTLDSLRKDLPIGTLLALLLFPLHL